MQGKECNQKHWVFKTWKEMNNEWIPAKEIKAKVEGNGWLDVEIASDYLPRMHDRFGILCSEGSC